MGMHMSHLTVCMRSGAALAAGLISLTSLTGLHADEAPYGFRMNGQSRYPDATPVTEWGTDTNVVWKTPMPSWSNASPALCGDRLFVCSEPTTVVCVNLSDGKIIWQKSNDYLDILADNPAELAKVKEQQKEAEGIRVRLDAKVKELREAEALSRKTPSDADLKKKVEDLRKEADPIRKELSQLFYAVPVAQPVNGYSSATPVTDGTHVWAVFGTGVVVCYDKAGAFKWGRKLENPPHLEWGSCTSPVLAGNVLLVQYDNLYGLDPATGKELWKLRTPWGWGTPAVAKIGDQHVAFTSQGSAVTVADGKSVADGLKKLQYNSPLLQDGTLYYIEEKPVAFKLPQTPAVKPEKLWDGDAIHKDRYYASPLLHDGLLYDVDQAKFLAVLNAKTGQKVYERNLDKLKATTYPSPVLAGKYVLVSDEQGRTIVLEAGREYKEAAVNVLEPFRSTPIFVGNRMYVRTLKSLYCIGK